MRDRATISRFSQLPSGCFEARRRWTALLLSASKDAPAAFLSRCVAANTSSNPFNLSKLFTTRWLSGSVLTRKPMTAADSYLPDRAPLIHQSASSRRARLTAVRPSSQITSYQAFRRSRFPEDGEYRFPQFSLCAFTRLSESARLGIERP